MTPNQKFVEALLTPPKFQRTRFTAHLYTAFSRKARGRAYVYFGERSTLWTHLEIDPAVARLNCFVAPQNVPLTQSRTGLCEPDAVSVGTDGSATIHVIDGQILGYVKANPQEGEDVSLDVNRADVLWEPWCKQWGLKLRLWSLDQLKSDAAWSLDMLQLVRRANLASTATSSSLGEKIVDQLVSERALPIREVIARFPKFDPVLVDAEIAKLILKGSLFTDLRLAPLTPDTQVSTRNLFPSQAN